MILSRIAEGWRHLVSEQKVVTIAAGLIVTVPVFVWLVRRSRKNESIPQIPLACPNEMHWLLGHAPLMQDMLNGLHKICVEESKVDGLSKFKLVGATAVSVLKAEHVKAALNASTYREPIAIIDKHIQMFLGRRSLVQLMRDEWKIMRKIMARAFNWEFLKETVVDIGEVTNGFIKALSAKSGQECDFWPLMKCITLDVIGKSGFGYDFACSTTLKSSPVAVAFEWMLQESMIRQFKSTLDPRCYFYSYPSDANRKHAECAAIIRQTLADIISKRRETRSRRDSSEHKDILKYMLDAHEEEGLAADTDTMVDNLITILFGGFDTSSITLTYALYTMTQHPDVEQRVVSEVMSVLGKHGTLTYDIVMNQLPYCTAVINELLRLYPPAPVTVRTLEEPLDIQVRTGATGPAGPDGRASESTEETVTIPTGTMMYIPIWWIHRSPLNFPDDPDKFDPDRFYSPQRAAKIHRFANVAFSGGARDCVGRRFAMLEAVGVFALLMRAFRFEAAPGYVLETEVTGIVQKPKGNMPLRAILRA